MILLSSNFVIAASDKNDAFYKVQMAYYNSIKTCSAGTFSLPSIEMFGQNIDFKLIVYGKKMVSVLYVSKWEVRIPDALYLWM